MITKFKKYKDKIVDHKYLKNLFSIAYDKAIKHFTNLHENITEDHVHEFINQYMINNYGVDLPHSKEMYKYVKYLLHKKILSRKNETLE